MNPVLRWWDGSTADERRHWHGLMLCSVVFLLHYTMYSFWYIEDAAISFAFAHHAALGEGFVAYPGGERVEGFSNPSWTLLLTAFDFVGITPWISAKLMGAAFGLLTLPIAWAWATMLMDDWKQGEPEQQTPSHLWPLVAPALLATSPQFVLWAASGLENSLFNLFLATGAWLTLRESRSGTAPLSALAWAGLAMTRPEAPLYAAVAGVMGFAFVCYRQGLVRGLTWALIWNLLFGVTFGLWFVWRANYFSWLFPNTYYAKLSEGERFQPFSWDAKGWLYLRRYALETGHGFLLPIYALGQTGLMGKRGTAGIALCMLAVALVAPGMSVIAEKGSEPEWWVMLRVVVLGMMVIWLPMLGIGRPSHPARVLAWALAAVAIFFALYSGGDWMRAFRWLSMASVPMAVLFADAARMIGDEIAAVPNPVSLRERAVGWLPRVIVAYPLIAGLIGMIVFLTRPETSPYDVKRRVMYMQNAQERLHMDHASLLEVDMGAHMWWSGFELVDIAGLIDVPMAHHQWEIPFIRQYVYSERVPTFAHVHPTGGWGSRTKLRVHEGWDDYIEIPGYPISPRTRHIGNNVRKDLFVIERWRGTSGRAAAFGDPKALDARLMGWEVPAPQVAAGQEIYVEVGLSRTRSKRDFRLHFFLSDGENLYVQELPPGYDWIQPSKPSWGMRDVVVGRHSLRLPDDLPEGRFDVGYAAFGVDESPEVLRATRSATDPRYIDGEVRWREVVEVVPLALAEEAAAAALERAADAAAAGKCESAHRQWSQGRRHLARDHAWQLPARQTINVLLSDCYAARARDEETEDKAVAAIAEARKWDHRQPLVVEVGKALAATWEADGNAAELAGDDERAYEAWHHALTADPSLAWVRHRAENARDRIIAVEDAEKAAAAKRKADEARERREARDKRKRKSKKAPAEGNMGSMPGVEDK